MINKNKILKEIRSWIFTFVGAFFIVVLLNSKVYASAIVQQSSMEKTLYNNERIILDKISYSFTEPKIGDIVVFRENKEKASIIDDTVILIKSFFGKEDQDSRLIKRVIGVPGDEMDIRDGYVYRNGEKLYESYVNGETNKEELDFPIKVGEDKLFVLGDNRPVSKDSRVFGLIDYHQVEGKAIFRIYPFNKIGTMD